MGINQVIVVIFEQEFGRFEHFDYKTTSVIIITLINQNIGVFMPFFVSDINTCSFNRYTSNYTTYAFKIQHFNTVICVRF